MEGRKRLYPQNGLLSDDEGILIREGNYETQSLHLEAKITMPISAMPLITH